MTYLEKWMEEHNGTWLDFKHAQDDCDGFCPSDMGMDECNGTSCRECWHREVKESEE